MNKIYIITIYILDKPRTSLLSYDDIAIILCIYLYNQQLFTNT